MLVYVRPSNEALLRARVPGAQDQRGCPSHPFHRARSASKKGTWPLPPHPSEAARCASTEDHQAPSPPLFREQEDDQAALSLPHLRQLCKIMCKGFHPAGGLAPIEIFVRRMVAVLRQTQSHKQDRHLPGFLHGDHGSD